MSEIITVYGVDYQSKFDKALEILSSQSLEYQQLSQESRRLLESESGAPFNILRDVDIDTPIEEQPEAVILAAATKLFHKEKLARLLKKEMDFDHYRYSGRHTEAIKSFMGKWVEVVPIGDDSQDLTIKKVRFNQFETVEPFRDGITGKISELSLDPTRGGYMHLRSGVATSYEVSRLIDVHDDGRPLHKVTFL